MGRSSSLSLRVGEESADEPALGTVRGVSMPPRDELEAPGNGNLQAGINGRIYMSAPQDG
jgi:hypothetical protein